MSRYAINKKADELHVAHATALLIWDSVETPDEFIAAIEAYANGEGFVLID